MNVAPNPFLLAVADRFMDRVLVTDAVITAVGVGVDRYRFVGDVGTYEIVEDMGGCVGRTSVTSSVRGKHRASPRPGQMVNHSMVTGVFGIGW